MISMNAALAMEDVHNFVIILQEVIPVHVVRDIISILMASSAMILTSVPPIMVVVIKHVIIVLVVLHVLVERDIHLTQMEKVVMILTNVKLVQVVVHKIV